MKLRQGWMHLVTLFTALVISSLQVNSQSLNYLITIPQTIRPGQELSVGVSLYGSRQYGPVMLNFGMERDGQELFTHKASVAVGETSSVVLPPLPLNSPSGHYQLNVMGVDDKGTTVFQNNTKISFNNRGLMTFVQTDKAIYKPGQTVKFRVFNLHPTLKHHRGQVDIVVEDPSGNRIQQWLSVSHPSGVVSKELPLSVQPPLGDWVISVTHKELEMKTRQTFTVAKYVLPKFEVNIQARSFVAQEEKLGVSGTIRAKYTYGKAVSGTAKVTLLCRVRGLCRLGIQCPYDRFRSREVKIVHSNIKVYGTVGFDFSYKEIISRTNGVFPWNMRIEAEVVEDLTGKNAESEMDIHVPNNRIKIEFFNTPNTFKPGLMYTACVRVTQYDGSPLLAQDRKATLKVLMMQKDEWGTKNEEIKTFIIPLTGFVKMNSRVKPKTVSLSLKATFLSTTMQHYVTLERRSPSNSFVQVTTDSPSAQADVPMMFTIDGTNKTQNIMYQVLSRGNLVAAGQVTCENYQTQQQVVDKPLNQVACGTFRLLPQALWAPFSKLLVYYIREDGEVVNDGISFAVEGIFGNKVELEWSKLQAAPTDNVSLQVTTGEAQAYVGLVVVDKSVLLLKDGNDITQEKVISEVAQFGNYPIPFYGWGMPRLWLPGGNDAASVFLEAGVIVLTDLKVPTLNPIIYMKDHVLEGIPGAPPLKYTMLVEPGHVRTLFPETWIWDDAVTGTNLFAKFTATVPDTMTSWVASAFSLGPNLGLGLAQRQEMVAFQPFFISLDLPYSIIRGEQFILKVTIFNHLKENKQVLVTMEKSDSWDISTLHHVVDVPSKDGITVTFSLSPRHLGQVPITVKAQSNEAADAITKHLLVKAEGLPKTFSKALLIDVNSANVHSSVKFTFPPNVVAGSETAFVTATGDIMGPSIEGLGKLVKMPYGCGEQNMVNFAPNIYVLQYLDATQQDAKAIRRDALLYMAQGYQRELTFQRQDGSFSAFGDSDKSGSTWLSAFVLKCFTQARTHMYIDPHIVNKTLRWLKRQRISSGEYKEPGRLLDGHLLGSSSGPAALTGFVLIGLLSDPHIDRAACGVDTSMKYLERMLTNGIEDIQALAIVTYALTLSGSTRSATALDKLNTFAIQKDGLMYWPKTGQPLTRQQHQSSSSIETAAYALLAHLKLGRKEQGLPIMRWLGQQRNSFGGFTSTQDTVVALEAMSFFAAQVSGGKPNLLVSISTSDMSSPSKFIINENNLLVLHKTEVPVSQQHKTLVVNVQASGAGVAFIQLNVMYNIIPIPIKHVQEEAYEMNVIMKDNVEVSDHYSITICTSRKDEEKGGMVVMEVYLLSGFSLDDNFEKPRIARLMEVENGKVILYFDEIQEEICITISATRVVPVSQIKSACVIVYEYYHLELRAERVYNSPKIM